MRGLDTLLISSNNRFILYHEGDAIDIDRDFVQYAGITWCHDFIYTMARTEHGGNEVYGLVFNHQFKRLRYRDLPWILAPHQIIYRKGEVFVANCGHNSISAWNRWDRVRTAWTTGRERIGDDRDTDDHVNSVWYDDQHFYVCEHRHGPSIIRVLDHDWNLVDSWDIGNEIHNVFVEDGMAYVYNSAHEAMIRRDLRTGKDERVSVVDKLEWVSEPTERFIRVAYTRGLAAGKDKIYVGCSAITPRGDRDKGDSAIAVFDNSLNYLGKVILKDTGGLGEIRVVDGIDRAHNGLYCPWDGTIPNV